MDVNVPSSLTDTLFGYNFVGNNVDKPLNQDISDKFILGTPCITFIVIAVRDQVDFSSYSDFVPIYMQLYFYLQQVTCQC